MMVSDSHIAVLRAHLEGSAAGHQSQFEQQESCVEETAYIALVTAAFTQAVERRFGGDSTIDDVSAYVGGLSLPAKDCAALDRSVATIVICDMLGLVPAVNLDPKIALTAKQCLLASLLADEELYAAAYDEVLTEARRVADRWLSSAEPDRHRDRM